MKTHRIIGVVAALAVVSFSVKTAWAQFGTGACCSFGGTCSVTNPFACVGQFQGIGTNCQSAVCSGACCEIASATCSQTGQLTCFGVFHGLGSTCAQVAGQCTGACCGDDGGCTDVGQVACSASGGTYLGVASTCESASCSGACCLSDGPCVEVSGNDCETLNGTFSGPNTLCADVSCPIPTIFTYQGRLTSGTTPYTGLADFVFSLWDAPHDGNVVSGVHMWNGVGVENGLFSVPLDFGIGVFDGQPVWLAVAVKTSTDTDFVNLLPRQAITATPYALQTRGIRVNDHGYVGIGTTFPRTQLEVNGGIRARGGVPDGIDTPNSGFAFTGNGGDNDSGMFSSADGQVEFYTDNVERVRIDSLGYVGIGTTSPGMSLEVSRPSYYGSPAIGASNGARYAYLHVSPADHAIIWNDSSAMRFGTELSRGSSFSERMRIASNGNVGIGTLNPQQKLDVNGTTRTQILQITGGSDVAEPYDITATNGVEPVAGMIVSLDPANVGKLRVSCGEYDTKVAGIISGANGINPGLVLAQEGTIANGAWPVASSGRVWCLVDADAAGAVQTGDLLTTSSTPGHAMRASDRDRTQGTVVGKAMSPLENGRGLVLVLVSLQ